MEIAVVILHFTLTVLYNYHLSNDVTIKNIELWKHIIQCETYNL